MCGSHRKQLHGTTESARAPYICRCCATLILRIDSIKFLAHGSLYQDVNKLCCATWHCDRPSFFTVRLVAHVLNTNIDVSDAVQSTSLPTVEPPTPEPFDPRLTCWSDFRAHIHNHMILSNGTIEGPMTYNTSHSHIYHLHWISSLRSKQYCASVVYEISPNLAVAQDLLEVQLACLWLRFADFPIGLERQQARHWPCLVGPQANGVQMRPPARGVKPQRNAESHFGRFHRRSRGRSRPNHRQLFLACRT